MSPFSAQMKREKQQAKEAAGAEAVDDDVVVEPGESPADMSDAEDGEGERGQSAELGQSIEVADGTDAIDGTLVSDDKADTNGAETISETGMDNGEERLDNDAVESSDRT